MADYYPLLARAVSGLSPEAKEQRRGIYERARKALLGQLRGITPPVPEEDIQRESQALDAAIARLESEIEAKVDAPTPIEATPPAAPVPPVVPAVPPLRPMPSAQGTAPAIGLQESGDAASAAPSITLKGDGPGAAPAIEPEAPRVPIKVRAPDPSARADAARDNGADGLPRSEALRPPAPRPQESSRGFGRIVLIIGALAVVFGGVGFAAWKWRDRPEDITRTRSPIVEQQPAAPASGPKVNERIGSGAAPTRAPELQPEPQRRAQTPPASQPATPAAPAAQQPSAPAAPAVPVAQRVGLLLQSDLPQGFDTQIGTVVWRTNSINRGGALSQAIRADFDVPDAKLKGFITIEKNSDPTLRASHTITVRFLPSEDSPLAKITEIGLPVMRNESAPNVEALAGVQAKITDNIFIVALTSDPQFAVRNIETIKSRGWLDIPMKLADGRAAKITLEKGNPGERVVNEVFDAWTR